VEHARASGDPGLKPNRTATSVGGRAEEEGGGVRRRLSLTTCVALVIANMIGAGVFTTSGFALADLGRPGWVLIAWAVGGLIAVCGALSYGAIAHRIPESGGEYTFLSITVHPLAGFLAGWVSLLVGFTAPIAVAALALQSYVAGSFGLTTGPEWIGTAAILIAGLMHGLRLRAGVALQNGAVALKLALIGAFVLVGVLGGPSRDGASTLSGTGPSLGAFAVTLVWISFAYSGWNAAVYVGGEVRAPERNLKRSLWIGTVVVAGVYLALNAVFLYSAPAHMLAGKAEVGAIVAQELGGPPLRRAMSALVALSLFTSISSMVMAGPRVYARMARDGLFPRWFGITRDVPVAAVALQVGLAILVAWLSELTELLSYIGFTLGLSAVATVGAVIALRRREGPIRVPVPGYPWVPAIFILATLGAAGFMAAREPLQAGIGLLTVTLGVPAYFAMRLRTRRRA
jgi:APA family basic amino acid/polyamine antiporter